MEMNMILAVLFALVSLLGKIHLMYSLRQLCGSYSFCPLNRIIFLG